jgi:chromosome segregation ATPase
LQQLGAFFEKEDARHDHYGAELSDMGNVLGGLKASQDSLQAGFQQFDQSIVGLRDDVRHVQDQSNINGELISGVKTDVLGVMQRVELVDKRVESLVNRVDSVEEGFDQLRTDVSTELDKVHARLETAEARLDIHEAKIELHDQLLMELHALDAARERLKGRRETTS